MQIHRFFQFISAYLLSILVIFSNGVFAAGDPDAGNRLFDKCRPCHGKNGNPSKNAKTPVPLLGGQHSEYIVMALNGYAGGTRDHAGMKKMVEGLSPRQKKDIGAYLSKLELKVFPVPQSGTRTEIEQKVENCRSCHGERGNNFSTGFPRLIGQNRDYLIKVMHDYKTETRKNPTMVYIMKNISEEDLIRFADYYSNQPDGLSWVP